MTSNPEAMAPDGGSDGSFQEASINPTSTDLVEWSVTLVPSSEATERRNDSNFTDGQPPAMSASPPDAASPSPQPTGAPPQTPCHASKRTPPAKDKAPSFFALFQYVDHQDMLLIVLGSVGAVANGAALPVLLVLFADFLDNLGSLTSLSFSSPDVAAQIDGVKKQIATVLLHFVYVALVAFVAAYTEVCCWTLAGEKQSSRVRSRYLKALLRKDAAYFEAPERFSGSLASRVSADTLDFHDAVAEKVGHFIQNISRFVAGFACAFVMTWQIALAMCAFIPVLAIPSLLYAQLLRGLPAKEAQAYAEAGAVSEATLGAIRTVYAFCGQEQALRQYSVALDKSFASGRRQALVKGLALGLQGLLLSVWAFMFWFGGYLVVHNRATGGSFCGSALAVVVGAIALGQAIPSIKTFSRGQAAAARMFPMIDADAQEDKKQENAMKLAKVEGHVTFQEVSFAYPSRPESPILNKFCLEVVAGSTVALVGPSGSGKSTLIALLEQFYIPTSGKILVDGHDLLTLHMPTLRQHMGLVGQEPALFATSIRENILYGNPKASEQEVEEAAKAANAYGFIMTLPDKFETQVGERGVSLSGGQKQRIAIARALIRSPAILLLDEATSALDSGSERVVQSALSAAAEGRTTLIVAHRLSTIRDADKIVVMKGGSVVQTGTHGELLGDPCGLYATLVKTQENGDESETQSDDADPHTGLVVDAMLKSTIIREGAEERIQQPEGTVETKQKDDNTGDMVSVNESSTSQVLITSTPGTDRSPWFEAGSTEHTASGSLSPLALVDNTELSEDASGCSLVEVDLPKEELETVRTDKGQEQGAQASVSDCGVMLSWREVQRWFASNHGWRVMKLARPEWPYALAGSVGGVCVGLINPTWAFMVAGIISVFFNPDPDYIEAQARLYALVVVGVGFAAFFMNVTEHFCFGVTGERLTLRVRKRLFAAMLRQEISWFDRKENNTGALSSKLSGDASLVRSLVGDRICIIVQAVSGVGAALFMGLVLQWKMTLVMLATFPVLLASFLLQSKALKGFSEVSAQAQEEASQVAQEALSQHRTVTALSAVDHVVALYEERLETTKSAAFAQSQIAGFGLGLAQFLLNGSYALALWYGAELAIKGESDPDKVLKVLLVVISVAVSIAEASALAPDLARAGPAVASVLAILDRRGITEEKGSSAQGLAENFAEGAVTGEVSFEKVTFVYPSRPEILALDNFSLQVGAGRKVALVGQSGSGKSTVISLLQRFYEPLAGRVLLDGKDIATLDLWMLRRCLGLVQQEPVLFACSIRENILYGCCEREVDEERSPRRRLLGRSNVRREQVGDSAPYMESEVIEAAKAANAHDFISSLPQGYDTLCGERGAQLSGGQKQRIAIARALLRNPAILLLDEATSALDSESEKVVQAALDKLMRSRTTITVAHRLSTIRNYDIIAVLDHGQILEQGKHEDLMKMQGSYHELARLHG